MLKFKELNLNPKNLNTSDCITRVLSYVLGISWEEALELQYKEALQTKFAVSSVDVLSSILTANGFMTYTLPKNSRRQFQSLMDFEKLCPAANSPDYCVVVISADLMHCLVVQDGYYIDSTDVGTILISRYFIKNIKK